MNTLHTKKIKDCVRLISGGTPSKARPEFWDGDIPWVSCKDMKVDRIYDSEDHVSLSGMQNGTRSVPPGTILIVVRGMILAKEFPVAMCKKNVTFNQDLKAIFVGPSLSNEFFYYWCKSNSHQILGTVDEAAHGTKRLQTDRFLEMDISIPPLPTQRRIASVLSAYDDLIENNTRRIKVLEEMARALYREWFVEFRFPGHEKVRMVDSELGRIPEGWGRRGVKDVSIVTYGFPFASKKFNTDGVGTPVIRIRDIPEGYSPTFTDEEADSKYHVRDGHILVGMDGDFHMCIWSSGAALQNQRVARFESKGEIGNYHLFLALEKPIRELNQAIVGTTVAHLGDMHIKALCFAWPPRMLLEKAIDFLEPISAKIILLKHRIRALRRTRDLLLPRLMSGEVDVSRVPLPVEALEAEPEAVVAEAVEVEGQGGAGAVKRGRGRPRRKG